MDNRFLQAHVYNENGNIKTDISCEGSARELANFYYALVDSIYIMLEKQLSEDDFIEFLAVAAALFEEKCED